MTQVANVETLSINMKQPKALYLLSMAQMLESFSYYGMRAILLLFMVKKLGFSDSKAYGVFCIYITFVEFSGIIAGYIADKFLGLRYSLYFGSIVIALGHIVLTIQEGELYLYIALSLISMGSALFKVNCCSILGEFYVPNDPRNQSGFTMFYTGINLGAFAATIACSYLAQHISWAFGFGLAAIGMFISIIILYSFSHVLEDKGYKKDSSIGTRVLFTLLYLVLTTVVAIVICYQDIFLPFLIILPIGAFIFAIYQISKKTTFKEKQKLYILLIAILLLSIFYAFQEQIGSTFILFIERCVDETNLFDIQIPSSAFSGINPCTIIIFGFIFAKILGNKTTKKPYSTIYAFYKINSAFVMLTLAFGFLYLISKFTSGAQINVLYPILVLIMISVAELFVGPTLMTLCIELSPNKLRSMMLGMMMVGYGLAGTLSGYTSHLMAVENVSNAIESYSNGFLVITVIAGTISILILIFSTLFRRK